MGYTLGRSRQVQCPMDFDVPLADGKPGPRHLSSVANFLSPKVQDTWWNEPHVEEFYQPSDAYTIAPSKIAGCGVFAARHITAGEKVGLVWVKDPEAQGMFADLFPRHFTPWFGRAVNHCPGKANSGLQEDDKGEVWTVAKRDIEQGEEITGDYAEAYT